MKRIRTIVFDLGGVLIDYDREACVKKFLELGFDNAYELIGPYSTAGCLLKLESGLISRNEFYDELKQSAPQPITIEQIDEAMYSFMLDIPEYKLDMLTDLRKQGYTLFMLSNTNPQHRETILRRFSEQIGGDMNALFEQAFYSDLLRCVKPNREIYEKVEKLAGLVPAETLFIDDKEENVAAARECGWRAHRLDPAKETILDLFRA